MLELNIKMQESMTEQVNVVCMKWGTMYSADYVNKLFCMVRRNLKKPFKFYCLTDDAAGIRSEVITKPLPDLYVPEKNRVSPWRKLSMFTESLYDIKGKTLFLDLDILIIDNIDEIFDFSSKFAIIENWTQLGQGIGNSSVYCFEFGKYPFVLERYLSDPEKAVSEYDNEQIFLSKQLGAEIEFFPESWIKSFKRHCVAGRFLRFFVVPKIPLGAKIIAFHGRPRPHQALEGKWPGKLIPCLKPAAWISNYWYED